MAAALEKKEVRYRGLGIGGGTAIARVCLFNEYRHNTVPLYQLDGSKVETEQARLREAIRTAALRVGALIERVSNRIGPSQGAIFVAQKMMIEDRVLHEQMLEHIRGGLMNAEAVVTMTFDKYASALSLMGNDYLKDRASDIGEVKRHLLDALAALEPSLLCAGDPHCRRGRNRIVVAEELTPQLTMSVDTEYTRGFVTERGGATSHAAILARSLGIPAVSGVKDIHRRLSCGTEVLIDGDAGEVIVRPSEATCAGYPHLTRIESEFAEVPGPVPGLRVLANISRLSEVRDVMAVKAEGIGLYRTEFEMLALNRLLTEQEQYEKYATIVQAMESRPATFRLFDIGGDKTAPFLELPQERNPYLGLRGARLLLARPELFEPQAWALARASEFGPVNVLYPMIVELDQFLALRSLFDSMTQGIPKGNLRHGVMFEVPSACLQARDILDAADFASVGTNDLVQYLFAVDRNSELVAGDYSPDRPVFWSLIGNLAKTARELEKPLSVCGEIATNPRQLRKLLALGIDTVSVSPRLIPEVRRAARQG